MRAARRWWGRGIVMGFALAATPAAWADPVTPPQPVFDPMAVPASNWWVQDDGVPSDGMSEIAKGLGAILSKTREISTERWEMRVGAYVWQAKIKQMDSQASSDDMRSGRANGYIDHTQVTTRDFEKDFGMSDLGDTAIIVNPEIMMRWGPSVIRLSWWQWTGGGSKNITEHIAYGDRTYEDGSLIDGDAVLSDSKFIYEYRVSFSDELSVFAGVSLHFIQTQVEFTYSAAWGWDEHGCPLGNGSLPDNTCAPPAAPDPGPVGFADKEKPIEGVPLVSISLRTEYKPIEGIFLTLDTQSMYLPFVGGLGYGYTDTKLGLWIQASRYVQLGIGGRFWFLWAQVEGLDKHDTEFEGRFEIEGGWAALMIRFP